MGAGASVGIKATLEVSSPDEVAAALSGLDSDGKARLLAALRGEGAKPHVVFLETAAAGHINPLVPLVSALCAQGAHMTFFARAEAEGTVSPGDEVSRDSALGKAVLAAGAELRSYRADLVLKEDPRLQGFFDAYWHRLPGLVEDLRALQPPPSIILYDPFVAAFAAAGRIVGIPTMGVVPHSGPGIMAVTETEKAAMDAAGVRGFLQEAHGLDLFDLGLPPMSWYDRKFNIVLTCDELFAPMSTEAQGAKYTPDCFQCVGTMNDPTKNFRPPHEGFPLDKLKAARDAGKHVIFLSLGSMVTGAFFTRPLGVVAANHIKNNTDPDDATVDGKTFAEMTGADFTRFVFRHAFDVLGGRDDLVVVVSCGKAGTDAVLEGLPPLPANFMAFGFVPQLDLLPLCSAFITHGGMNSVMEAMIFRVPVVVVPVFGDQMWNADCAQKAGIGFGFRYPLKTLSADALKDAVLAVVDPKPDNKFKLAVEASASKMERTGGPRNTARLILERAASH